MLTASRPGLVESAQQAFRVKPLGRVRLNRHHWLAPYLLFFAPLTDPSDKIRDLVTGDEVALGAGISWYNHPEFGWMLEYDGSTTVGTEMDFGRSFTCGTHGGLFLHWDMDDTSSWSGTASFLQLSATSEVGVFISHASNFYRFGYGKSAGNFANAARFAHFHRANNFSQCRGFVNGYFALESSGGSSTGDTTGSLRLFPTPSTRLCRLSYIGIYDTPTLAAASHWDSEEGRLYNTLYDLVVPEGRKFYSYSQGGAAPATAAVALTGNSATLAASASFSPGTKTATATLTGTSVTLAVAATHEPEHFATASLTAGGAVLGVLVEHTSNFVIDNFSFFPSASQFGLPNAFPIGECAVSDGFLLAVENLANDSIVIYKTTNGGGSWSVLSTPLTAGSVRRQGSLTTDGAGNVWISYKLRTGGNAAYVKKSTDSGATWGSEVTVQNSDAVVDPQVLYLASGDLLYVYSTGTALKQYRSTDGGANWLSEGTIATAASGTYEDLAMIEFNSQVRVGCENEITENGHGISVEFISDDDGDTYGTQQTIYDDANNRADNDGGNYVVNSATGKLEWWFSTDEDDRTGAGTSPSYDKNKVKKVVLTSGTWGDKETMYDSFSNVEVTVFYNDNDVPVIATTKGYWPSGSPVMELISVVDPASYLFADSPWTIDRGMAWVTTINGNKVLRVQGFNHATEPVTGTTGVRAWVSRNTVIADGEWSVIARTTVTGADFRIASRYTDASNHYAWIWNSTNKDQWFERANQNYTTIGTQNTGTTIAANTDYTCLMTLSGGSFSASINAVARGTGSDATIASGKIALGSAFLSTSLPVYYRSVTYPTVRIATVDLLGASASLDADASFSQGSTATVALTGGSAVITVSASFSPGTKTATANLVGTSATLAVSATYDPGTKTATATLLGQTAALSSTVAFEEEFESTVALLGQTAALVASAIFDEGIFQVTATLTATSASLAASASFAAGTKTASAALTGQTASLIATAAFTPPPTAVVTLVSGSASLSASTSFAPGTKTATAILIGSGASLSSLVEVPYEATVILAAQTAILATTATHEPPTFAADAALVGSTATIQGVFIFAEAGFFVNAVVELFASSATLTAFAGKRFPPHSVKKFEAVMRYTTFEGIKRTTSALAV